LSFGQNVALHGLFHGLFAGAGFQVEGCVQSIELEIVAVG